MGRVAFQSAYGQRYAKNAEATLGTPIDSGGGEMFRTIKVGGTWDEGNFVTEVAHTDLVSATETEGTVTAAAAIGARRLQDTGNFTNPDLLVGAIGQITSGTGVGQVFVVTRVVDANTIGVDIIAADGKRTSRSTGWQTALDTSSKYRLGQPGMMKQMTNTVPADRLAGLACSDAVTADIGKYTQIQVSGLALVIHNFSLTFTQNAAVGSKGKRSVTLDASVNTKHNAAGYAVLGVDTAASSSVDHLMPVMLDIPHYGQGMRASDIVAENNS